MVDGLVTNIVDMQSELHQVGHLIAAAVVVIPVVDKVVADGSTVFYPVQPGN